MVKCFRLALPHAVSLPAVRLYLDCLPLEANTGPCDVDPISEAWSHALRDFVQETAAPVVSYVVARKKFPFVELDDEVRARDQAVLRLKREAWREAEYESEERRRRDMSPLEETCEERAAETVARIRANTPALTVAGTRLPLVFPVAPEDRWTYASRSRIALKPILADTLHAEVNMLVGLTPYHGVSPIFGGPNVATPGPQHQMKTLGDIMHGCLVSCLQASYADRAFEQRLARAMFTNPRTAPVEKVAEFAQLVGWDLT
eukprot:5332407-Pleurochrysis_carterae.AAC.1